MKMPDDVYDDLVWCLNWVNLSGLEGDCKVARRVLAWLDAQPATPVLVPRLPLATGVLVEVDSNRQIVFVADGPEPRRVIRIPVDERRADVARDMALSHMSIILEFAEEASK